MCFIIFVCTLITNCYLWLLSTLYTLCVYLDMWTFKLVHVFVVYVRPPTTLSLDISGVLMWQKCCFCLLKCWIEHVYATATYDLCTFKVNTEVNKIVRVTISLSQGSDKQTYTYQQVRLHTDMLQQLNEKTLRIQFKGWHLFIDDLTVNEVLLYSTRNRVNKF